MTQATIWVALDERESTIEYAKQAQSVIRILGEDRSG